MGHLALTSLFGRGRLLGTSNRLRRARLHSLGGPSADLTNSRWAECRTSHIAAILRSAHPVLPVATLALMNFGPAVEGDLAGSRGPENGRQIGFFGLCVATAVSGANLPLFRGRFQKPSNRNSWALRAGPFWGWS
jgi:hypothetical protein